LIDIEPEKNVIGLKIIGIGYTQTLFLLLWTDKENQDRISESAINDFWSFKVNN